MQTATPEKKKARANDFPSALVTTHTTPCFWSFIKTPLFL